MDLDELNFSEICRCCKRTKSVMISMISIFGANGDPIYPPVDEMLRSIASINVQENDGLPSLVCTLCLNNIQDAFTFILRVNLIHQELSEMFARRREVNTLQDTYDICESVKKEGDEYESDQAGAADSEDVKHLLKVEELDEPMPNCYQPSSEASDDSSDENIDIVVQSVSEIERARKLQAQWEEWEEWNFGTPKFTCEVCNQEFQTTRQLENHKIIYCVKRESSATSAITIPRPTEDIQKYYSESEVEDEEISLQLGAKQQKMTSKTLNHTDDRDKEEEPSPLTTTLQTRKDLENMKKSYAYTGNNNDDDGLLMVQKIVDYQEDVDISVDSSDSENAPHGSRKRKQTFSDLIAGSCHKSRVQEKNKTKAKKQQNNVDDVDSSEDAAETYNEADDEEIEGNVTGGRSQKSKVKEKKKTETERQQSNVEDDDSLVDTAKVVDDEEIEKIYHNRTKRLKTLDRSSKLHVYKCKLCPYSSARRFLLRRHLQIHCKEQPFTCSKCNRSFASRPYMFRHERKCNGKISRHYDRIRRAANQEISLQDLDDPLIINKYYTVTEIRVQDNNVDVTDVTVQPVVHEPQAKGRMPSKPTLFKCKLCRYASLRFDCVKLHLFTHCKDKPVTCLKCKRTFTAKIKMARHRRVCNRTIGSRSPCKGPVSNLEISPQELADPLQLKKYYTEIEIAL